MEKSRRQFLKNAAIACSAMTIVPSHVLFAKKDLRDRDGRLIKCGSVTPSDKVNLACCGIGNQGGSDMNIMYNTGLCNIVALCDTDMGAPHTLNQINKYPDIPRYQDFRRMFDEMSNEIDAVLVGTPDHSHFPITMLGMSLGKAVYVEKPLARTFNEVELMIKAAKKYGVVTQMGNQGHSEANYFQFKAWTEAGIIKDVTAITAHMNGGRRWHKFDVNMKSLPSPEAIPETLDWDTWLMAVGEHGYNKDFINGQWRCWYDFGMGALGDWGAHIIDTAHEFLNLGLPYEVNPIKLEGHNPFFFPMASTLMFRFPGRDKMPPCDITWYDGVNNIPEVPEGYGVSELDPNIPPTSVGKIQPLTLNPGKILYSKELVFKGASHGKTLSIIPEEKAREMEHLLPEVPESTSNHWANFLKAVKGEEQTRSPFEVAGPLSQVLCLGVLAQRLNVKLKFDRKKKRITNNKLANQLLVGAPPRKGWEEFYKL